MHKLLEYVCEELEELERKADKNGKLSMQEIQYMDTLAHAKKNLLTADAMMEAEDEEGYSNAGGSYARGGRGGSRGRYSREGGSNRSGSYGSSYEGSYESGSYARGGQGGGSNRGGSNASGRDGSYERGYSREDAKEELAMNLRDLKMEAKDQETAQMIGRWIKQLEQD